MIHIIVTRLASIIGILFILVLVIFLLERVVPGDPVRLMVGPHASAEVVKAQRHALGMDRPIYSQYLSYLNNLVHGKLGMALHTRRPVLDDLVDFFPATAELIGYSLMLAAVLGMVFGFSAARGWLGFGAVRVILIGGSTVPVFLLGMVGILVFYRYLGWFPVAGRTSIPGGAEGPTNVITLDAILSGRFDVLADAIWHLTLPAICLALAPAVAVGRVFRSSIASTMRTDYVRTARAKGLTEHVVFRRHVVRNSMGPTLSIAGLQVAILFANVVIIESIFGWPGLGLYTAQSISRNDFPAIAGVTLTLGILYIVVNTIIDICQAIADPRLRL